MNLKNLTHQDCLWRGKQASCLTMHLLLLTLVVSLPVYPQNISSTKEWSEVQALIRKEGMEKSQVLRTLHFLTDVYGPRLTGSPSLKAAGEWAIQQMSSWGLANGHLEPWDFGHLGWLNERHSVHMNSPVKDTLECEVLAWTPSTNGTVTAQAFQLLRGGREQPLQARSLIPVLRYLSQKNALPTEVAEQLIDAYWFLRNTEHALQALEDRQTQALPSSPLEQARLAWVMGFEHWQAFYAALNQHRDR